MSAVARLVCYGGVGFRGDRAGEPRCVERLKQRLTWRRAKRGGVREGQKRVGASGKKKRESVCATTLRCVCLGVGFRVLCVSVCKNAEMCVSVSFVDREWDKLKNKQQKKAYINSLLTTTPFVSRTS